MCFLTYRRKIVATFPGLALGAQKGARPTHNLFRLRVGQSIDVARYLPSIQSFVEMVSTLALNLASFRDHDSKLQKLQRPQRGQKICGHHRHLHAIVIFTANRTSVSIWTEEAAASEWPQAGRVHGNQANLHFGHHRNEIPEESRRDGDTILLKSRHVFCRLTCWWLQPAQRKHEVGDGTNCISVDFARACDASVQANAKLHSGASCGVLVLRLGQG